MPPTYVAFCSNARVPPSLRQIGPTRAEPDVSMLCLSAALQRELACDSLFAHVVARRRLAGDEQRVAIELGALAPPPSRRVDDSERASGGPEPLLRQLDIDASTATRAALLSPAATGRMTAPALLPVFLTARQVAEMLQVDERTVLRWAQHDASMPATRLGRVLRFEREPLLRWLAHKQPRASRRLPPVAPPRASMTS